jgi:menaquinone-dependent protoporphyrinogen oxidase
MAKILVTYATMAGSTKEVAERIAQQLGTAGVAADTKPIRTVTSLDGYSAVIVAAPMIIGWHREAQNFVAKFADRLAALPVAYCMMCYELADTGADTVQGVPVTLDPQFRTQRKDSGKLSFKEKQTTVATYVQGPLKKAPGVKPVGIGIFKGAVDFSKLSLFPMLFVRVLIRAKQGDYRNWDAITAWVEDVYPKLAADA